MARITINDNEVYPPVKGFSHAVKVKGEGVHLFISGILAKWSWKSDSIPWHESVFHEEYAVVKDEGDIEGQTRHILESIKRIVTHAGGSLDDIVRIVIYLVNMEHYPIVHRLRMEYFGEHPPASTCVQVSRLYDTRQLIEIEATAIIPQSLQGDL